MAKKIPRAGLIPYYIDGTLDTKVVIMTMTPSNYKFGGKNPQIAKGKVEHGETSKEAAIREAYEELGLLERNLKYCDYLGKFLGYTDIYYGEIKSVDDFVLTTDETEFTTWMTVDEFFQVGREIQRPIVRLFAKTINERVLQNH